MHHHASHEAYVDLNLPPEVAHSVFDRYYAMNLPAGARPITNGSDRDDPQPVHTVQHSDEQAFSEEDSPQEQETFYNIHPEFPNDIVPPENHPQATVLNQDHEPPPPPSHPTTPQTPAVSLRNEDLYRSRMVGHIGNLRNFSDGLEYQLQFTDFHFLEELEREGARFFAFVRGCLKKEEELVSTDRDTVPHTPTHSAPSHSNRVAQPAMAPLEQQPFETIPGINPLAL